jgi:hypothetical protein
MVSPSLVGQNLNFTTLMKGGLSQQRMIERGKGNQTSLNTRLNETLAGNSS